MQKTLVIILGLHAVGKMTVGRELTKITPCDVARMIKEHFGLEDNFKED